MEQSELLDKLNNPPEGLKFYLSGSRAMEARRLAENVDVHGKPLTKKSDDKLLASFKEQCGLAQQEGFVNDETDYDFFCKHDDEHVKYLSLLGFYHGEYDPEYRDTLCTDVATHPDFDVQVVLRSDPLLYKTIFDTIPIPVYYHVLWKSSPLEPNRDIIRQLFNTFFALAQAVKEVK